MTAPVSRTLGADSEMAADLSRAGFFAVANDLRAGRCSKVWALDHVRKTIPKRNERGQAEALAVLDKWGGR